MKITVVRLSSLGDTVLITPILRALKNRFPDAHISVLVKKEYTPVFFESPHVDELIALDVQGPHRGVGGLLRLTKELRAHESDLFLDLHRNLRSRWITVGIKAKRKMAYNKRHWSRWALVHAKWLPMETRHTVDLYFDALRPLGIESRQRVPEIFLKDEEIFAAKKVLANAGIVEGREIIGIHVGARSEVKRWHPVRFAHIADAFQEQGWQTVLFAGEADRQFLKEVCAAMHAKPPVFIQPSLRRLMALIDRCSVFVCHDSGPMHLAVARKVPVVALFGPTHPKLGFWPLGEGDIGLTANVECSPCSLHGTRPCRKKLKECMEYISEDRVCEAVVHSLRNPGEEIHVRAERSPVLQKARRR
ncbi:MAG: glycosyltransferase family 9 protein [Gemmatimonadota bacterium]|nr:MAG: glycosyltransferase family 9 protein [Gemmatimonadota bacterium]